MHDELREVAPGLYVGPVIERCPCPKLRGYIGLQREACDGCRPDAALRDDNERTALPNPLRRD